MNNLSSQADNGGLFAKSNAEILPAWVVPAFRWVYLSTRFRFRVAYRIETEYGLAFNGADC